jgi:hypothetical protein
VAITKTTTTSIKDASVEEANINNCAATNTKLGADAVTSAKINNGTVTTDDLASTLDLSSKTITLPDDTISFDREYNNIGLLGFKMAVNESLTVFNLVDGVVDEFNDESGTDEAEGSNDTYCGTSDFYSNSLDVCVSAGFAITSVTEPDTSTAGTNPDQGQSGQAGTFTVPTGLTSVDVKVWGAGGGSSTTDGYGGAGGGFASGTLAVSPSQAFTVSVGEGGAEGPTRGGWNGGGSGKEGSGSGGGLSALISPGTPINSCYASMASQPATIFYMAAGSGGGPSDEGNPGRRQGGAGGGLTGFSGTGPDKSPGALSQVIANNLSGGGGDQEQGGGGGGVSGPGSGDFGFAGALAQGGTASLSGAGGGGGAGFYGGGGGAIALSGPPAYPGEGAGGGGSSYYGHPQVTSGSTTAGCQESGGGTSDPQYVAGTNEGTSPGSPGAGATGEDGYVLISGSTSLAQSTTIVSTAFTSTSVATNARIVVFEENIDTPTLNTDIIASVSRDGTNFTNATLSDSGYVTGSSGQRILTGQADISGQPSGQSMRWKLQLANNQVKIHGVSLSWA